MIIPALSEAEARQAFFLARIHKALRASIGEPPALPPEPQPEPEEFRGLEDDEEIRDRYQDRPYEQALAAAVRDLSDGELLALAGIDPHSFGAGESR